MGTSVCNRSRIDQEVLKLGPTLTTAQLLYLCKPCIEQEIKNAMFSTQTTNPQAQMASQVDFTNTYGLKLDLWYVEQCNSYSKTGRIPKQVSATKLIVLPKVSNPETASESRPISCYNVTYKCISKLICRRLKKVLPHLIDPSEAAFVQGREILYNILIC